MSVAAPTTFTVTGGASITITLGAAWSTAGTPSQVVAAILATTTTINSNSYTLGSFFDNAPAVVKDMAAAASVSQIVAENLFRQLQYIIVMYIQQALSSAGVPFSIALA
jgi:hypothetical protein